MVLQISLRRLVLSLSDALDFVHPRQPDHQKRVAYVSLRLADRLGLAGPQLAHILQAAAFHDIGLICAGHKLKSISPGEIERFTWYPEIGYRLLRNNPWFARAAEIIRYHLVPWANGRGAERNGIQVPFASQILHLADFVERATEPGVNVLEQIDGIVQEIDCQEGRRFHPDCAAAFRDIVQAESFWLDLVSPRIYSILLHKQEHWPVHRVDMSALQNTAEVFARVVDTQSRWTTTHSAGVAASAVAIAEKMKFSPPECGLMRVAGYLHDLGKLSVPSQILDKPGQLDAQEWAAIPGHAYHTFRILSTIDGFGQITEWAAYHHERIDGSGYPFHLTGDQLTLGSRIMAVADAFTALIEDRPYRKGMTSAQALNILERHVRQGGFDGDVVKVLLDNYEDIDSARSREQNAYAKDQNELSRTIGPLKLCPT